MYVSVFMVPVWASLPTTSGITSVVPRFPVRLPSIRHMPYPLRIFMCSFPRDTMAVLLYWNGNWVSGRVPDIPKRIGVLEAPPTSDHSFPEQEYISGPEVEMRSVGVLGPIGQKRLLGGFPIRQVRSFSATSPRRRSERNSEMVSMAEPILSNDK